jgi:hypothetical protein
MSVPPDAPEPRLYTDLAAWWPLMSAPADYAEEAAFYADLLAAVVGRRLEGVAQVVRGE